MLWAGVLVLCVLSLGCGLTEVLQATPTPSPSAPAETPGAAASTGTPEPGETPTATSEPGVTPSATPEPVATSTVAPPTPPSPADTPQPSATPGLGIVSFEVQLEDRSGGGKLLTCTWQTASALGTRIIVGTSLRFAPWRELPPNGSTTFELQSTVYRYPTVTLTAYDGLGGEVTEVVTLDWPCPHTYFFEGEVSEIPAACPVDAPYTTQGAQQAFQNGLMVWIPGVEGRDMIYVTFNDTAWQHVVDTWDESQPEDNPAIVPPAGLYQPIRGFGKAWRETPGLRDRLGWATGPEAAVTVSYQREITESLGGVQYYRASGSGIIRLTGLGGAPGSGNWMPYP